MRKKQASAKSKLQLEKENKTLMIMVEETLTAMESNTEQLARIIEGLIDKFDKISKDADASLPGLKKASSVQAPPIAN